MLNIVKKALAVMIVLVVLAAILALRRYGELMPVALFAHASSGSTDCGTATSQSGRRKVLAAIECAKSAAEHGRPFHVLFKEQGIDVEKNNALITDGNGNAIELFHATGVVNSRKLLKNRCNTPLKLVVEEETSYDFPRVHCAPWPPEMQGLSTDYLLW